MKIVIHGPRRHLPTSVPYRTDPLAAFTIEQEARDLNDLRIFLDKMLPEIRTMQVADLDAQEAAFCAKYEVQRPLPAGAREKAKQDQQANEAAMLKASAEPSGPAVTAETRHALRKAAMRLQELTNGEPVNTLPPRTQPEAEKLLRDLNAAIYDIEAPKRNDPIERLRAAEAQIRQKA